MQTQQRVVFMSAYLLTAASLSACIGDWRSRDALNGSQSGGALASNGDQQPFAVGVGNGNISLTGCSDVDFARMLWAPVISNTCYGCHIEGGMAQQRKARFTLVAPTQSDYIAKNLASVRAMAAIKVNGEPLLLLKPTGQVAHGGGTVLPPDSSKEQLLRQFLANDDASKDCHPVLDATVQKLLTLKSDLQTVRQAALILAGRLPNSNETALTQNGNILGALDSIIKDPQFDATVHRVYNDIFLTDARAGDNAPSLRWDVTYGGTMWYPNTLVDNVRVSWGMTQNVPQLIAYVIRQDRPFTEILTGNYVLANPMAACSLLGAGNTMPYSTRCSVDGISPVNRCTEASMDFSSTTACNEFLAIVPHTGPVCGVLSDLTFLSVVSTTVSNRNRHRAAFIMQNFLDLDPLSLGPQLPPGASSATSGTDPNFPPTLINPQCVVWYAISSWTA